MRQLAILMFMVINISIIGCDYPSRARLQGSDEFDAVQTECGTVDIICRKGGGQNHMVFRASDTLIHYRSDKLFVLDKNREQVEFKYEATKCGSYPYCLVLDWSSLNSPFYVYGDSVFVSNNKYCKLDTLKIEYIP